MLSPSPPNVGGLSRQSSCTASPASPDVLLIDQEQHHRPVAAAESTPGFVVQLRANFRLQVVQTIDNRKLAPRAFLVRLSSPWDRRRSLERQFPGQCERDPTSTAQRRRQHVQPQARPASPFFSPPAVLRTARLAAIVAQRNRLKRQVPGGKSARWLQARRAEAAAEAEAADEAAEREAETAAERAAAAERGRDLFGQYTASLKVASVLFAPDVPVS